MSSAQPNPYESPYSIGERVAALASESERATFIRRTYLHLTLAIFGFAGILALIFTLVPQQTLETVAFRAFGGYTWLVFLGGFMAVSWIARSWAESTTSQTMQYLGLSLYVLAQSVLFVPLLYIAQRYCGPEVIPSAGIITMILFGGLTLVVFITKTDFSFLRMFLIWGGVLALGLIVCSIFFQGLTLGVWFSVAMIALASGYILYDTSNVMHHYRTSQYVAAALALFASVALMFWYVIQLLMYLSGRD